MKSSVIFLGKPQCRQKKLGDDMRTVLSIVLALAVIYGLLKYFRDNALENLDYVRSFDRKRLYAGDSVIMKVELLNHKLLPLPWLRMAASYPSNLTIKNQKFERGTSFFRYDHISVTSLFSYQKLTKVYELTCEKRGHYTFCDVKMRAGDWFGLETAQKMFYMPNELIVYPKVLPLNELGFIPNRPDGSVSVNRWIMPDPIEKVGLREYSYSEPFHAIDWKATARTGQMMVANFDYKADPALMILLNTAHFKVDWKFKCQTCFEDLLNLAASMVEAAVVEGVPVGMTFTAAVQSSKTGQAILPDVGQSHGLVLLEVLAKLSEYNKLSSVELLMLYEKIYEPHHTVFFLTEKLSPELIMRMNHLANSGYNMHVALLGECDILQMLSRNITVHHPVFGDAKGGNVHVQMA